MNGFEHKRIWLGDDPAAPSGMSLRPLKINLAPHPHTSAPMDTRSVVLRLTTGEPVAAVDFCVELGEPGVSEPEVLAQINLLVHSPRGLSRASLRAALEATGHHPNAAQVRALMLDALHTLKAAGVQLRRTVRGGDAVWCALDADQPANTWTALP